ncbi:MAG: nucleoside-triphosphatase [Anaerolineae bacterium]
MKTETAPRFFMLTGARGTGKTTLCWRLACRLKSAGFAVSGLVTQQPDPHTLVAVALHDEGRYTLTYPWEDERGVALPHFRINPEAMAHSVADLRASFPTRLFVLDELGPLELLQNRGWVEALTLLKARAFDVALLVVRPTLLDVALRRLPTDWITLVHLTRENREALEARLAQVIRATLLRSASCRGAGESPVAPSSDCGKLFTGDGDLREEGQP